MKKVLILAYDFPPYVSVGALRPYSWYKYLNEYDVYPIVITRQWQNKYGSHLDYIAPGESEQMLIDEAAFGKILRTPYRPNLANRFLLKYGDKKFSFTRKIITGYFEYTQWLLNIGPKSEIFCAAKKFLQNEKVDLIIASGDPFILFKYAAQLSKTYSIPWIADYRDPWSQGLNINNIIVRCWNSFFEKKIVKSCAGIITVSSFVQFQISQLLKQKKFYIIPNGYDPESIDKLALTKQNAGEFSIALSGTIYNWHPIFSFLFAINEFVNESSGSLKIKIYLYGINNAVEVQNYIDEHLRNLQSLVVITTRIPNQELLEKMAKHNVMLLFNYYSYMGTKIYDYLGLRRLILMCFADDSDAKELKKKYFKLKEIDQLSNSLQSDLITETNSGIVVKDKEHLKQVLHDLYHEFTENGFIACNSTGVEKYSRKIQTQKLAEIIKEIINNNKP